MLLSCLAPQAHAGSLPLLTFEPTNNTILGNLYSSAVVATNGGVGGGGCLAFDTANGQEGDMGLFDLDSGSPISGFDLEFDLRIGSDNNSPLHGDGFSINFGPDVPQAAFGRAYAGKGSGLIVSFATTSHNVVTNTSGSVRVSYNNRLLGYFPTTLNTGSTYSHLSLGVKTNGLATLKFGATTVFSGLYCFPATAGQFLFGADSQGQDAIGDPIDLMKMDNLAINTTNATTNPYTISVSPMGIDVSPRPMIQVQLQDAASQVNPSTLRLLTNNTVVPGAAFSISQVAVTATNYLLLTTVNTTNTIVTYYPTNNFGVSSSNRIAVTYYDNNGLSNAVTSGFLVLGYTTLPSSYAVPAANVTIGDGNPYQVYPYRTVPSIPAMSMAIAQEMQAYVFTNNADLSFAGADGSWTFTGVNAVSGATGIDFSSSGPKGFLTNDFAFPFGSTTSSADEWVTFLQLTPGTYNMGVDVVSNYTSGGTISTDSGFQVSVGPVPRDMFAPVIASFDNSFPEGYKEFAFVITNAGIYPFRMFNFNGPGGYGLEWYLVSTNGARSELSAGLSAQGNSANGTALLTHPYVQYQPSPNPGQNFVVVSAPILATVVDGINSTTVTNSITMTLNGVAVSPLGITNVSLLFTISVSTYPSYIYQPATHIGYAKPGGLPGGQSNVVVLSYSDTSGSNFVRTWGFNTASGVNNDPDLLVAEAEEYNTITPGSATNGANYGFTAPDPNSGLLVPSWVFGSSTVTNFMNGDGTGSKSYNNLYIPPNTNNLVASNFFGYSGSGVMLASPNANYNVGTPATNNPITNLPLINTAIMTYNLYFKDPAVYYIWARGWGDANAAAGTGLGSSGSKSIHFGIDGELYQTGSFITANMGGAPGVGLVFTPNAWNWGSTVQNSATRISVNVTTPGFHSIDVIMREDGFTIDKFLLTTNVAFVPSGLGPAKNLGSAGGPSAITSTPVTGGFQLSWTGGTTLQNATNIAGPWTTAPEGSVSPVTILIVPAQPTRFFRVMQ